MENTINYLNSKMWYRLIKVVYLILFLTILISSLVFAIDVLKGKSITQESLEKADKLYSCGGVDFNATTQERNQYQQCINLHSEIIEYEDTYALKVKIFYVLLDILAVVLFFEFVKKCFYYIVLGSINQAKK